MREERNNDGAHVFPGEEGDDADSKEKKEQEEPGMVEKAVVAFRESEAGSAVYEFVGILRCNKSRKVLSRS